MQQALHDLGFPGASPSRERRGRNEEGHYHYFAYGVPRIALWFEASAGPVISPYSTFLALGVQTSQSLANLRRMAAMGWVGAYGFYEAADYIQSPRKSGAGAGVDGASPGHVSAGRHQPAPRQRGAEVVPRESAGAIRRVAAA